MLFFFFFVAVDVVVSVCGVVIGIHFFLFFVFLFLPFARFRTTIQRMAATDHFKQIKSGPRELAVVLS